MAVLQRARDLIAADMALGDIGRHPAFTERVNPDGTVNFAELFADPRWSTGEQTLLKIAAAFCQPNQPAPITFIDAISNLDDFALKRVLTAIHIWRGWVQ